MVSYSYIHNGKISRMSVLRSTTNKLDANYNIVASPLYSGYSGPWLQQTGTHGSRPKASICCLFDKYI